MMPLITRRDRSLLCFWALQTSEAVELVPISFMHAMIKKMIFPGSHKSAHACIQASCQTLT